MVILIYAADPNLEIRYFGDFMANPRTGKCLRIVFCAAITYGVSLTAAIPKDENPKADCVLLPSGQRLTPLAAPEAQLEYLELRHSPQLIAHGAMSIAVSPDRKILLVLTSGYNRANNWLGQSIDDHFTQYVFVYEISASKPAKKQVIRIPGSFAGIAFSPDGRSFYVGGGKNDNIYTYSVRRNGSWAKHGPPIQLGHQGGNGLFRDKTPPITGGLAVTADGSKLIIANVYNDSVSVVDLKTRSAPEEIDLRPGKIDPRKAGVAGGEYPFWVVVKGNDTAYVSSVRDREIVILHIGDPSTVRLRIKTKGNPNQMILDRQQIFLYVAEDNSDSVTVIDTRSNKVVRNFSTAGAERDVPDVVFRYPGSAPSGLTLSPDGTTLYVTNGGANSVAVIRGLPDQARTIGLIPTGYYPYAVSASADGRMLYVINGKSQAGPNRGYSRKRKDNQFVEALQRSSLLSFRVPAEPALARLSAIVAENNFFTARQSRKDELVMAALRQRIKHIIYIIKENRTYDQILGDLDRGNGDPRLTEFGERITPNFHHLAEQFVDLDNFFDSGDVSGDGWAWSTAGRETDFGRRLVPLYYAGQGATYDFEGTDRQVNVGWATVQQRRRVNHLTPCDPDLLPGTADVAALDGPRGTDAEKGYLWDAALRAGLTIRNYGCLCDLTRYEAQPPDKIPYLLYPAKENRCVAFPTKSALMKNTDPFFRGYDNAFPDYYRECEWGREFDRFCKSGRLPTLEFVRLMHDHMGNLDIAIDGLRTPELQQADNDYAVGRLVDRVAHSRYKSDTLIFIVEDDAQDGADHVDAHRSTAYVAGPYVKQGKMVSEFYTTVSLLRTIEDILGLQHLNIYTATQSPMTEVFDLGQSEWTFNASPSRFLYNTQLPFPRDRIAQTEIPKPTHDSAYWAEKTAEFDFTKEDNFGDPARFNRVIWEGLKGNVPYPSERNGADLRKDRRQILQKAEPMPK
jgi:YVTN family beta-propeller protein